jgi:hypothetical protein
MGTWVHRCPWCGWSRDAASPTMLKPRCEGCGGLLEAVPATGGAVSVPSQLGAVAPRLSPAFSRLLRFALVGLLMFAAARFGWNAGGVGLAICGVGIVGLFTIPLALGE